MGNFRSYWRLGMAPAVMMTFATSAWSQGTGVVREVRSSDLPAAGVISPQENDRRIARWLALDNRMILECAKLGKDRAENIDVQHFAELLADEHQKCLDDLQSAAGHTDVHAKADNKAKKQPATTGKKDESREADTTTPAQNANSGLGDQTPDRSRTAVLVQDAGKSRDARIVYHPTDFLAVRENVCNSLHDIAKKEWESVNGAEFDRAFLKHQIMAHELLIATMKSVRSTASSEMQASMDRASKKLIDHLQMARHLSDPALKTTGNDR